MIETTFIRLERGAEMLGEDPETLLIAAIEGRIRLYGLTNQYRRILMMETVDFDYDGVPIREPVAQKTAWLSFVPIGRNDAAAVVIEGITPHLQRLSEADENGRYWEDAEPPVGPDFASIKVPRAQIYVRRKDIEAIRDNPAPPEPDTSTEPSIPDDRAHISDRLTAVIHAARRWWGNADRYDPSTHPNNAEVAAWLQERGMSQSQAERAASIIRPEWAYIGRRPDA